MFHRSDNVMMMASLEAEPRKASVIVAGPGSSLTIPGIIVSEVVSALAKLDPVIRIEVDLSIHPTVGLHRAPSLSAAHDDESNYDIVRLSAPRSSRERKLAFRKWIGPQTKSAIAYAWPGIDNSWIRDFLLVANEAGVSTTVMCASLPESSQFRAVTIASILKHADFVLVGHDSEAKELRSRFGSSGPMVETHRALSLRGRGSHSRERRITAFLPKESGESLLTLMAAFDAIPEARIHGHNLQVVMRYAGSAIPNIISHSYHTNYVQLIGEDVSTADLQELCNTSSALTVADPAFDSRAFSTALGTGIATVVLGNSRRPAVGRGYVGGLLANHSRPASVHVALSHALRLTELGFPSPDAWKDLADLLVGGRPRADAPIQLHQPRVKELVRPARALEPALLLEHTL